MTPVALITGGAVRVGRAISEALAAAGYRVWIHHHHSTDAAAELAAALGPACLGAPRFDLADEPARAALVAAVTAPTGPADGRLDLLVNNAALTVPGRPPKPGDAPRPTAADKRPAAAAPTIARPNPAPAPTPTPPPPSPTPAPAPTPPPPIRSAG